jgi:hypothetical protein
MSQAVSRWTFRAEEWFRPMSVHVRSVVDEVPRGLTFPRVLLFFHVTIIIPMLHTYVHLHVAITRRKNGRNLETLKKAMLFR